MTTGFPEIQVAAAGDLQVRSWNLVHAVRALDVTDVQSFALAGEYAKLGAALEKEIHAVMDPICAAADRAHKIATEKRGDLLRLPLEVKRLAGTKASAWQAEQVQLRREAEANARRERERLEDEERARVAAERARLLKEAEDICLSEAVAAAERGDVQAAEKLLTVPVVPPAVAPRPVFTPTVAVQAAPKLEGVSFREEWAADVESLMDLVQAVANGKAPITLVQENMVALNQMARALKKSMNVPGVRAVSKRTTSVRA